MEILYSEFLSATFTHKENKSGSLLNRRVTQCLGLYLKAAHGEKRLQQFLSSIDLPQFCSEL